MKWVSHNDKSIFKAILYFLKFLGVSMKLISLVLRLSADRAAKETLK